MYFILPTDINCINVEISSAADYNKMRFSAKQNNLLGIKFFVLKRAF